MIDAGSTGADDVDDFYQLTRKAATEVYALLNISRVGLIAQNELANMAEYRRRRGEAGGAASSRTLSSA